MECNVLRYVAEGGAGRYVQICGLSFWVGVASYGGESLRRRTWSTNRLKFPQMDLCGCEQSRGELLLFLAV